MIKSNDKIFDKSDDRLNRDKYIMEKFEKIIIRGTEC